MGLRVIYVMTHDSIGLGEDGPTHQPVEHLAALRAIPNLQRDAPGRRHRDGGMLADRARDRGQRRRVIALTRQNLPTLRERRRRQPVRPRAPISWPATAASAGPPDRLGLGSRSSPSRARDLLAKDGIARRGRLDAVVGTVRRAGRSLSRRGPGRRRHGSGSLRGGERLRLGALARRAGRVRRHDGLWRFGAKAADLYKHFGITAEAIADSGAPARQQ